MTGWGFGGAATALVQSDLRTDTDGFGAPPYTYTVTTQAGGKTMVFGRPMLQLYGDLNGFQDYAQLRSPDVVFGVLYYF